MCVCVSGEGPVCTTEQVVVFRMHVCVCVCVCVVCVCVCACVWGGWKGGWVHVFYVHLLLANCRSVIVKVSLYNCISYDFDQFGT